MCGCSSHADVLTQQRHGRGVAEFSSYHARHMSRSARHLRLATWLALVAMLALVLMPMVSRALASQMNAKGWIEVCSAQGARWVSLNASSSPADDIAPAQDPSQGLLAQLDHCDYCSLAHATPVLPSVTPAFAMPLQHAMVPELFLQAPRRLHVWSTAQSRAPPLSA